MMNKLCEETVHMDFSGQDIKYSFLTDSSGDKATYGFCVDLYEDNVLKSSEIRQATDDLATAVKLYGLLIKHKVTPIDLEYVIEDTV